MCSFRMPARAQYCSFSTNFDAVWGHHCRSNCKAAHDARTTDASMLCDAEPVLRGVLIYTYAGNQCSWKHCIRASHCERRTGLCTDLGAVAASSGDTRSRASRISCMYQSKKQQIWWKIRIVTSMASRALVRTRQSISYDPKHRRRGHSNHKHQHFPK